MDENNQMSNQVPASGEAPLQKRSSGTGSLVGAVIIILLLAFGALYFWGAKLNDGNSNPPPLILGNEPVADETSDTSAGLPPMGSSDEAAAIEADIEAMNFDQLDAQTANNRQGFEGSAQ